jgi:hypothetical protein
MTEDNATHILSSGHHARHVPKPAGLLQDSNLRADVRTVQRLNEERLTWVE